MPKQLARLSLAAGVIAVTFSVAVPAYASAWSVSGGTLWYATSSTASSFTLRDITSNTSLQCPVYAAQGTIDNGTGLPGTGIGAVVDSTFGTSKALCTGSLGLSGTGAQYPTATEYLNAISYDSPVGETTGYVSLVDTTWSFWDIFGTCSAEIMGDANLTYTNSTGALDLTNSGTLRVMSASGPGGTVIMKAGDTVTYTGAYSVSPRLTITSP